MTEYADQLYVDGRRPDRGKDAFRGEDRQDSSTATLRALIKTLASADAAANQMSAMGRCG